MNSYTSCKRIVEKDKSSGYKIALCIAIAGILIIALYVLSIMWVVNYLKGQIFSVTDSIYNNFLDLNNASQKPEQGLDIPPSPFVVLRSGSDYYDQRVNKFYQMIQNSDVDHPANLYLNFYLCNWIQAVINKWYSVKFSYNTNHHTIKDYGNKKLIWCKDVDSDIIAFRGSQTSSDTLSCIHGSQKSIYDVDGNHVPGGYHTGIVDKFSKIVNVLNKYIEHSDKKKNLILTGHSMGGCLACMTALYLRPRLKDINVIVKTFGIPRFSDMEGNMFIKDNFLVENVVNQSDIFTNFPPSVFPGREKSYLFTQGSCLTNIDFQVSNWVGNHLVQNYRDAIFNILSNNENRKFDWVKFVCSCDRNQDMVEKIIMNN